MAHSIQPEEQDVLNLLSDFQENLEEASNMTRWSAFMPNLMVLDSKEAELTKYLKEFNIAQLAFIRNYSNAINLDQFYLALKRLAKKGLVKKEDSYWILTPNGRSLAE